LLIPPKFRLGKGLVDVLCHGPLVDDLSGDGTDIEGVKKRRSHPFFQDQPSSQVDATNFVVATFRCRCKGKDAEFGGTNYCLMYINYYFTLMINNQG
jgi:hypothetical protein